MTEQPKLEPLDEDWERALAVVAHPDDLEYGASSAVARWTSQGKEVTYVMVTCGQAGIDNMSPEETGRVRAEEERHSAHAVGVTTVEFLDHPDGMIEYGIPLRRDIARCIRRYRPQVLISLNPDLTWGGHRFNMADHRHVGLAIVDAARDAGNRWVFPELIDEGLQPWSDSRLVCFSGSPHPTHAVDVTGFLEQGIESLKAQKMYLEALAGTFDPAEFLRKAAESTGRRFGTPQAVAFEVYLL